MNEGKASLPDWLWWLLPVAALAALLGWETDWGRSVHRLPPSPGPLVAKAVTPSLLPEYRIEGGLPAHPETVGRTLFNPTRRPAPVALAEQQAKPRMQRGQFVLTGTTVAGERNVAFLRELSGGRSRMVKQGDQLNGVLVAEVKPDRVKLTLGDESEDLFLKVAAGPPAPIRGPLPITPGQPGAPQPNAGNAQFGPAPPGRQPEGPLPTPEQRRAARAAQLQGQALVPAPVPGQASAAAPAPVQQGQGAPASTDPAWNEVFRRMQQRSQTTK